MLIKEAVGLIKSDLIIKTKPEVWADLGCGSGMFTNALANLLTNESKIYAVDKNKSQLNKIPDTIARVKIEKIYGDFTRVILPENLDGILMANSLHYVKDKSTFIQNIKCNLKSDGSFLIIEYDMDTSNPWVPYPISFTSLQNFFRTMGYNSIYMINEMPSRFRRANIYSAVMTK
jgi:ubiquinone/menaquinone biosynthesis C-methylase UbiE